MGFFRNNILFNKKTYDNDAIIFFNAVVAAGGALTATERNAVNTYVKNLKSNSLWTPTLADYPLVGASAAAHQINLKTPGTFNLTFVNTVAGDHAANGWTPNGTTSYAKTGIVPSVDLVENSVAIEFYSRTEQGADVSDIGAANTVPGYLIMQARVAANNFIFYCYNGTAGQGLVSTANTSSVGSFIGSRVSSTDSRTIKNGAQVGSTLTSVGGNVPTIELYLGGYNNNGSVAQISSRQYAGFAIFSGLTVAQSLLQYNARQAMNATLGRQV